MKSEHHTIIQEHENDHWWYRVRRELVHDVVQSYFPDRKDLQIADIGCGEGALAKEMEQYGRCIGVDPSEQALDFCRERGIRELVLGSADRTGLPDATFDMVTCLDVLEHLPEEEGAINEVRRILKPGGIGVIFVPAFMFLWGATDISSNHYRRYRLPEIVKKFETAQFKIIKKSYFNTLLFLPIALLRVSVRLLSVQTKSEVGMGNNFTNEIFYKIFSLERHLLRNADLPFGVSAMVIVRKK